MSVVALEKGASKVRQTRTAKEAEALLDRHRDGIRRAFLASTRINGKVNEDLLRSSLRRIVLAAGKREARLNHLSFDPKNPRYTKVVDTIANDLLSHLIGSGKDARTEARSIIPRKVTDRANRIRDITGLDPRQARKLERYRQELESSKTASGRAHSARTIETSVTRLRNHMIRVRANLVAETEAHRTLVEGIQAVWDQNIEDGVLQPTAKKISVPRAYGRTCPACLALVGQEVPVAKDFKGIGGPVSLPVHPGCGCTPMLV